MNGEFLSGGLVFAVGAVLWVAYLVPSWLRRRHFNDTEANTVRMQHAVAAMTVAGLDTTHLRQAEASARAVHEHKKVLRDAERAAKRRARSSAHDALTPEQRSLMARHRRRRARQVALIFLLASLATLAVGVAYISYVGDILIAVIGGVGTLVTLGVMSSLAGPAQVSVSRRVVAPASVFDQGARPAPPVKSWTPQAVPRSLQQSPGSVAAGVVAQQQAADARRRAMAEQAYVARVSTGRRAEPVEASTRDAVSTGSTRDAVSTGRRAEPTGPRAEPVEAASQAASKFAGLGIVDDADTASFDLDSALKRRRVG
jgi:hypothetical protein